MFINADFFKFNKKNDEQMFINVKKSLIFNFLLKTDNERLLKRTYDNNNNISVTVSAFD